MYSVNQPGDINSFDEKVVSDLHNKVFNLLYNVLVFYELYRDREVESSMEKVESKNVLDQWILARISELAETVTDNMDNYKFLEPVRGIREFIDDLSTWYVRRSRERLKDGDVDAKKTLYYILKNLVKLMAPFAPFASEDIWQKLKNENDLESVHLVEWPELINMEDSILEKMKETRRLVSLGLESRQKHKRPIKQSLNLMLINDSSLNENDVEFIELIREEVNIKKIYFGHSMNESSAAVINTITLDLSQPIQLDTFLTEELKQEGNYRELVRAIQDMRKKAGLNPNDTITLEIETSEEGETLINKFNTELLKSVGAKDVQIKETNGEEVKIGDLLFKIKIEK
jgi:isoleucyl-tRNA synthetase